MHGIAIKYYTLPDVVFPSGIPLISAGQYLHFAQWHPKSVWLLNIPLELRTRRYQWRMQILQIYNFSVSVSIILTYITIRRVMQRNPKQRNLYSKTIHLQSSTIWTSIIRDLAQPLPVQFVATTMKIEATSECVLTTTYTSHKYDRKTHILLSMSPTTGFYFRYFLQ